MPTYVLDTDAFILYLMAEERGVIRQLLHRAEAEEVRVLTCSATLAEVMVQLAQRFTPSEAERIMRAIRALPIDLISITDELIFAAAQLRANYGLDANQAIAAATAQREHATLLTRTMPVLRPKGLTVQAITPGRG